MIKRIIYALITIIMMLPVSVLLSANKAGASPTNLISDLVYKNEYTMDEASVQAFINQFPKSCLLPQNYPTNISPVSFLEPTSYFSYGSTPVSAAKIIYKVSRYYHLNPQVLLSTLEKEQGIVSGNTYYGSCIPTVYNSAMGYNCPDGSENALKDYPNIGIYRTCVASEGNAGFSRQVNHAAWQLRFDQERSYGNTEWGGDGSVYYYGRMTEGYRARVSGGTTTYYDGYTVIDGQSIKLENGSTAALYNYTPHFNSFERIFTNWFGSPQSGQAYVTFKSHVTNLGWTKLSSNIGTTGTIGQNLSMQAFKINGEVEYSSYSQETGWQPTVSKGMISGTTGYNRPIQAVKIKPIGALASQFDIYYRTHVSNIGWLDWTKDSQTSGSTGDNTRNIEAIDIQLVSKGSPAPGATVNPYANYGTAAYSPPLALSVASHVAGIGWQPAVTDMMVSGTTEQARSIEASKVTLVNNSGIGGSLLYSAQVAGLGWQPFVNSGQIAGTTGQARQMETIRFLLAGDLGKQYDIWYRAHVSSIGWLGWVKNGVPAGSVGVALPLEAYEIKIIPKSTGTSPTTGLYNPKGWSVPDLYSLSYSAHVSDIGWINSIPQMGIGGTVGRAKPLEALRLDSLSMLNGDTVTIKCSAYVRQAGWINETSQTQTCGTVGQAKPIQSIRLTLDGVNKDLYDIHYRAHLSGLGWQSWVKNGEEAGRADSGVSIEAIMVKVLPK